MNVNAYFILHEKGLPSPSIYSLDMIKALPAEKQYYLRYDNELSNIESHAMNGNEILKNKYELERHYNDKILLQIEDVISTVAGGAIICMMELYMMNIVKDIRLYC